MNRPIPKSGDKSRHFKNNLYQIEYAKLVGKDILYLEERK